MNKLRRALRYLDKMHRASNMVASGYVEQKNYSKYNGPHHGPTAEMFFWYNNGWLFLYDHIQRLSLHSAPTDSVKVSAA